MGIFIFVSTHPIRPQDFWWHIAIGREIAQTGKIPQADVYSYTANGQAYPSYQMFWLMETSLYEAYHLGGAALVIFVHSLIITAAYVLIFWICLKISRSWRIAAFSILFAAALGLNDWNVRPQGITFLLASLFLLAIYQYRQNRRWYWLVVFPLGMLIWVNSHGTFLIGLVLIGLWLGQEVWDSIAQRGGNLRKTLLEHASMPGLMLVLTALACLVNPRGLGIIGYIKTLTSNSVVQNLVTEWAPPNLNSMLGVIFFACLLGYAVVLAISPKRPDFFQVAAFIIFGLLGIKTARGIVWFGLIMAPAVADHLSAIVKRYQPATQKSDAQPGNRLLNIVFTVVILGMGVISLPWWKSYLPLPTAKAGLISVETPVEATQVLLQQNPPGRLFNSMSFGSYLIWAAYPQYQVFVDTRIELFPDKIWLDYLNISSAAGGWEASLRDYGVNTLILSPDEQPGLIQAAFNSQNWKKLYQDNNAYIFVRVNENTPH